MLFQSIEEKCIYERLTVGKSDSVSVPASKRTPAVYEQTDAVNITQLQALMDNVADYIGMMEQTRINSTYRPLFSGRKRLAKLVVFVKRVIRRLVAWYVEPVCQQQTAFNNAVTPAFGRVTEINNELMHSVLALTGEQARLDGLRQAMEDRIHQLASSLQEEKEGAAERLAATEAAFNAQLAAEIAKRREGQARLERLEHRFVQSQQALEAAQRLANQQLIALQSRMDKLNKLDLDVFSDMYHDPWEKDAWDIGTFAQSGEDMVLAFILRALGVSLHEASYIDLGANHAKKISNTYHFYRQGARGVLVEANPALIPELKFYRNGDAILNRCVSGKSGEMVDFFIMGDSFDSGDGLSTSSRESALMFVEKNANLKIHRTVTIETISVSDIVAHHLGKTPTILNIDIEGSEMEILHSIDFSTLRPLVIIIETIPYTAPFTITERNREPLDYLTNAGYWEYAFTGVNSIFLDKVQLQEMGALR